MALLATVTIDGGIVVEKAYVRVTRGSIYSTETEDGKEWRLLYDVDIYRDEDARKEGLKAPCGALQHFKTDYDLKAAANPIELAYGHLKTILGVAEDC